MMPGRYDTFRQIVNRHGAEIICRTEESWEHAFSNFEKITKSNDKILRREENYILAYLIYGLDYLNYNLAHNSKLSNELEKRGFYLKFGGIFTHQSPYVELDNNHPKVKKINKNKKTQKVGCEIGDLLVVFAFVDRNNFPLVTRAFLMQAKMNNEIVKDAQFVLYEDYVRFRFKQEPPTKSSELCSCNSNRKPYYCRSFPKGWHRRYYPKSRGLKYLRIYPNDKTALIETLHNDQLFPSLKYPFGLSIFGSMVGVDGWEFNSKKKDYSCGWNSIILYLIKNTANKIRGFTTKKNYQYPYKYKRGQYLQYLISQFNSFRRFDNYLLVEEPIPIEIPIKGEPIEPNHRNENREAEPYRGINTILIMVKDSESEYPHFV